MSNIINCREDLIVYIKSIILRYCPYMEDRLLLLGNAKSPELEIDFNIYNNESQIMFIFGNNTFKSSIPEQATTSYIISFEEICDIIDFILEDHEVIKDLSIHNKEIDLKFAINWSEKSIKGILCGDITLSFTFEKPEIQKQYLYLLLERYYTYLEQTPSFKIIKNEYINKMKQSYFEILDKNELMALLNKMTENELKDLLYNLDNDIYIKYVMDDGQQLRVKKLSLEDHNKK